MHDKEVPVDIVVPYIAATCADTSMSIKLALEYIFKQKYTYITLSRDIIFLYKVEVSPRLTSGPSGSTGYRLIGNRSETPGKLPA